MFNIFFQRKALKERKGRVMVPLCTCCLRLLAECDVHAHMSICAVLLWWDFLRAVRMLYTYIESLA